MGLSCLFVISGQQGCIVRGHLLGARRLLHRVISNETSVDITGSRRPGRIMRNESRHGVQHPYGGSLSLRPKWRCHFAIRKPLCAIQIFKGYCMAKRYIIVERCGPGHCPHCNPDAYRRQNYCGLRRVKDGDVIDHRVKTFPRFCPLNKVENLNSTQQSKGKIEVQTSPIARDVVRNFPPGAMIGGWAR
jgi:hypothetical protein